MLLSSSTSSPPPSPPIKHQRHHLCYRRKLPEFSTDETFQSLGSTVLAKRDRILKNKIVSLEIGCIVALNMNILVNPYHLMSTDNFSTNWLIISIHYNGTLGSRKPSSLLGTAFHTHIEII
uniref:Uncharacterized protein n=1 Tax=Glossina brevipalpis TaxID=37001 RepID=A0A1A9WXW9_9MUSC